MFSRRDMLAATAVGGAMTAASMTTAEAAPVKSDISLRQSGRAAAGRNQRQESEEHHRSRAAESGDQGPVSGGILPPATDVGSMPLIWASFNNAPRRIQNGGWARQVTQADFAISDDDLRRQHAADRRRHPRAALAPGGRVGDT